MITHILGGGRGMHDKFSFPCFVTVINTVWVPPYFIGPVCQCPHAVQACEGQHGSLQSQHGACRTEFPLTGTGTTTRPAVSTAQLTPSFCKHSPHIDPAKVTRCACSFLSDHMRRWTNSLPGLERSQAADIYNDGYNTCCWRWPVYLYIMLVEYLFPSSKIALSLVTFWHCFSKQTRVGNLCAISVSFVHFLSTCCLSSDLTSQPSVLSATPSVTHSAKDLSRYSNLPTFLFPFLNSLLFLCSFLIQRQPNCLQNPRQNCKQDCNFTIWRNSANFPVLTKNFVTLPVTQGNLWN